MKALKFLFFISFFTYISCGSIARTGCKAVSKSAVRSSSKSAVKSGSKAAGNSTDDILRQLKKNPKKVPHPNMLPGAVTTYGDAAGSSTARSVVPNSAIELKVLSSSGSKVSTLSNTNSVYMKIYTKNQYRQEFINIVDDVFANISKKKITSPKQLDKEILKAVKSKIGNNKSFTINMVEGRLTCSMDMYGMSGTINIVAAVKDGLIIGVGGYYVTKELNEVIRREKEKGIVIQIEEKIIFDNRIKGYIFDKKNNQPLHRVKVKWVESNSVTYTHKDGYFSFYVSGADEEGVNLLSLFIQKEGYEVNKIDYKPKSEEPVKIFLDLKGLD